MRQRWLGSNKKTLSQLLGNVNKKNWTVELLNLRLFYRRLKLNKIRSDLKALRRNLIRQPCKIGSKSQYRIIRLKCTIRALPYNPDKDSRLPGIRRVKSRRRGTINAYTNVVKVKSLFDNIYDIISIWKFLQKSILKTIIVRENVKSKLFKEFTVSLLT